MATILKLLSVANSSNDSRCCQFTDTRNAQYAPAAIILPTQLPVPGIQLLQSSLNIDQLFIEILHTVAR